MTTGSRSCCMYCPCTGAAEGWASPRLAIWRCLGACVEITFYGAFVLNHRVVLHP